MEMIQKTTRSTITVDVPQPNVGPQAVDDDLAATEDTVETFDLIANDTDENGDALSITHIGGQTIEAGETVDVGNGTVTLNDDGSINFMPAENFSGEVSFDYTVSDGNGGSDTATASIDVEGVADGAQVSVEIGAGQTIIGGGGESGRITASNWDAAGDGISITAYDNENGGSTSTSYVRTGGESSGGTGWIGVERGGGNKGISNDEQLIISFDNDLNDATISFQSLGNNDRGYYKLYNNGVQVGSTESFDGDDDVLNLDSNGQTFDQIVIEGRSDKFKITSIDYTEAGEETSSIQYPVTFAVTMFDDSESLVDDAMSVDLSSIPHGSEISIGDATVTIAENGSISVSGDDVSVDGTTLNIPSSTLGGDLSVQGTVTVPTDDNGSHDTFDLSATVQTVDGDDTSLTNMDLDVAGTTSSEVGTDNADSLYSHSGEDAVLSGEGGSDILYTTDGDDVLQGGAGDDTLYANDGDDVLKLGEGADEAYGGAGNDVFIASPDGSDDVMAGNSGDDMFIFNAHADAGTSGTDWVDGGEDFDTIALNGSEGWTLTITNEGEDPTVITSDTAGQMEEYSDTSGLTGQIEFDDGSTVIFEGVEKVEW